MPYFSGLIVVLLLAGMMGWGTYRLEYNQPFEVGPRVALIQGNISQEVRNARSDDGQRAENSAKLMAVSHFELTEHAVTQETTPDVVIWPETSYPGFWPIAPDQRPETMAEDGWQAAIQGVGAARQAFAKIAEVYQVPVMLGLNSQAITLDGQEVKYNTALLVSPEPKDFPVYHKMHRVPFGEFVPFKETLPFMKNFSPYDFDYGIAAGTEYTRFPVKSGDQEYHFGVLICYEDSDPSLAKRYVGGNTGEDVDFLVNISNDGWFKGTEEHEQHLAICRFRAVEARRSVARSVNMGISAVIDGNGRVIALPADTWAKSKKRTAVVSAEVPIDNRDSLYAHLGDWLPAACGLLVVAGIIVGFWRRRDVV